MSDQFDEDEDAEYVITPKGEAFMAAAKVEEKRRGKKFSTEEFWEFYEQWNEGWQNAHERN